MSEDPAPYAARKSKHWEPDWDLVQNHPVLHMTRTHIDQLMEFNRQLQEHLDQREQKRIETTMQRLME